METTKAPASFTLFGEGCSATLTLGRYPNERGVATHVLTYDPAIRNGGDPEAYRATGGGCMRTMLQTYSDAGASPGQLAVLNAMLETVEDTQVGAGCRIAIAGPAF